MTESKRDCEREYDFALVLTGVDDLTPEIEGALFDAGCDDATLSIRIGQAYLTFSRKATSRREAVLSAIRDVRKSGIGADVRRVDSCGLVTQSEIARRIGRTRQLVHQYIAGERGPGGFPPPSCHISDYPFWAWCEVACWLWQNDMIKEDVLLEAEDDAVINNVLDLQHRKRQDPKYINDIFESLSF